MAGSEADLAASATSAEGPVRAADDSLVSIAVIAGDDTAEAVAAVETASAFLRGRFDFHEILLLVGAGDYDRNTETYSGLLGTRNLRCLVLRDGVGEYRAAIIAATETIGDIVVILRADEAADLDLAAIVAPLVSGRSSVVLRRKRRAGLMSGSLARVLSAASGYVIDPRSLRSAGHSRAHIGRVADRADREIALRFLPRGGVREGDVSVIDIDVPRARRRRSALRRFGTALEVVANAPPHLLRLLAASSFAVSGAAILYFLYAVTLFGAGVALEPGWLTTSVAISGTAAFLGFALGGIAMALYQILNLLRDDTGDEVLREIRNTDLFRDFRRINVETIGRD